MIVWSDYLRRVAQEGVQLLESEDEAISEEGLRIVSHTLYRTVNGGMLTYAVPVAVSMDEPVPWYVQRQAANRLRLPPEKFIFDRL